MFPCLLVSLLIFEHLSAPLPLSDLRVPALYDQVAAAAGDFALLELPPGWRNGARVAGKQDVVIMQQLWYQTRHGKRLLGGNTSRNPEFKFQYFSEDPTLARLIALTNAADLRDQHAALTRGAGGRSAHRGRPEQARAWAAFLNIRYVMVHRDKLPAETEKALAALLPATLVGEEGDLALYRVAADLAGACDLRGRHGSGAHGPGRRVESAWPDGAPVYAQRRQTRLLLPLPAGPTTLRLHMRAAGPNVEVALSVNGETLGARPLAQTWEWLEFALPADPGRPPLSDVTLRFSALADVAQVRPRAVAGGENRREQPGLAAGAERRPGDRRLRAPLCCGD